MPKEIVVYEGWVGAKKDDRAELESMGAEISGDWNPIGAFDYVRMTVQVYNVFRDRWKGRGVWGMIRRKREVYTAEEMEDIPF